MQNVEKVQNCADALKSRLPRGFSPQVALVLGTGLGGLSRMLDDLTLVPYTDLPDYPLSSAPSHGNGFAAGFLAGVPVLAQQGRCHLYEGRTPADVCMGVRIMAELGAGALIITNAAGAIDPRFEAGSLMLIEDHINWTGKSPLTGPNQDGWGLRFPDMSQAYDREYLRMAEQCGLDLGIRLEKGTYFCIPGPQLETRAETRAYRLLGGDAVGMSTVLEVIAARHRGMRVLGISCLTNKNLPDCMAEATIEEIVETAGRTSEQLQRLIAGVVPAIAAAGE